MINIFCCTLQVCAMKSNQKNHFFIFLEYFSRIKHNKKKEKKMKPHVNLMVCKCDFCEKLEIKTF